MDKSLNFNIPAPTLTVTAQAGRPVLGDFLQITLFTVGDFEALMTFALQKAADLESALDLENESSEISKLLNIQGDDTSEISEAVGEVIEEALYLSTLSSRTFDLFREDAGLWEVKSLIRGYIIDQTVKCLTEHELTLRGVVQLAEGMRFFNCPKSSIHVRTGSDVTREIVLLKDGISTTNGRGSPFDQESTVVYLQPLRRGISSKYTVSVIADTCMSANALANIGLYAEPEVVQACVNDLKAQLIVFNEKGDVVDFYEEKSLKAYSSDQLNTSYSPYDDSSKD
ncbi:MAG: hypothetical protein ACKOX6_15660 [Bdellovibrio sp.]